MNGRKTNPNENLVIVQHPDYETEIIQILRSNFTPKIMRARLLDYHENDIAAAMEGMSKEERKRFYSILDTVTLAQILEYSEQRDTLISELSIRKRIDILSHFEAPTAVEYLRKLEKSERQTILDLMDEQLSKKDKLYLVAKEGRVGLIHGFVLGLLSFLLIGAYLVLFKAQPPALGFSVSLCTGIALLVSILLSSITGTVIPILFKKLKIDPAVASGPLITTINDLVAIVTYYGLAWLLLIQLLGF